VSGADITNVVITCVTHTYNIGGTVSGLNGTGLVLQNNSKDDLGITENGGFTFLTPIDDESTYDVTVLSQPLTPEQTCSVDNGNDRLSGSNVTNVTVNCVDVVKPSYTIGGVLSGLVDGETVTLQNNGGDDLTLVVNGAFAFVTPLEDESAYSVTVLAPPVCPGEDCTISNSTGNVDGTNVTDVRVLLGVDEFFSDGFESPSVTNNQ
jgi:hypothetical protein